MKKVLLLGSGGSASINFARSLKGKFKTVGIDSGVYSTSLSDTDKVYRFKHKNDKELVSFINKVIKKEKIDFIHAQPDPLVRFLAENKHLLDAKTMVPSLETVDLCQNKLSLFKNLDDNGIPVPKTFSFEEYDLDNINLHPFNMFKENPVRKLLREDGHAWVRCSKGAGGKGSILIKKMSELMNWIEYWGRRGIKEEEFLVSEYLPGDEVSWQSVWFDGELVCSTARKRLLWLGGQASISGVSGTTAYQQIICGNQFNLTGIKAVMSSCIEPPNGIFSVDMKKDKNGVPKVMEINPGRFSTTNHFMTLAGCNMCDIFVNLGLYGELPSKYRKINQLDSCTVGKYCLRMPDSRFVVTDELIKESTLKRI